MTETVLTFFYSHITRDLNIWHSTFRSSATRSQVLMEEARTNALDIEAVNEIDDDRNPVRRLLHPLVSLRQINGPVMERLA